VSITDRHVFVTLGGQTFEGTVERVGLESA
jgi:hypothetical protein